MDNVVRMKASLPILYKTSNTLKTFEHSDYYFEKQQEKKALSTLDDEQRTIFLLQETFALQSKKISNWVVEVRRVGMYLVHLGLTM